MEIVVVLVALVVFLLVVAGFAGLAFFFIRSHQRRTEKIAAEWKDSAAKLGLSAKEDKSRAFYLMDGSYKGIPLELGIAQRMIGGTDYFYTYCRIPFSQSLGLGLKVDNYILTSGMVKGALGMDTLKTGNAEFDSKFSFSAASVPHAMQLLTREFSPGSGNIAAGLAKASAMGTFSLIQIDDGGLLLEEKRMLYGEEHLRRMADWGAYLAGRITLARRSLS